MIKKIIRCLLFWSILFPLVILGMLPITIFHFFVWVTVDDFDDFEIKENFKDIKKFTLEWGFMK